MVNEINLDGITSTTTNIDLNSMLKIFEGLGRILAVIEIISLVISILTIVEYWIIFNKCGKKGVASIVPFWNLWTLFQCASLPGWLSLIPVANILALAFYIPFKLSKNLGKGVGVGFLCFFFPIIGFAILAFSKSAKVNEISGFDENSSEPAASPEASAENATQAINEEPQQTLIVNPDPIMTPDQNQTIMNTDEGTNNQNVFTNDEVPAPAPSEPEINSFDMPLVNSDANINTSSIPNPLENTTPVQEPTPAAPEASAFESQPSPIVSEPQMVPEVAPAISEVAPVVPEVAPVTENIPVMNQEPVASVMPSNEPVMTMPEEKLSNTLENLKIDSFTQTEVPVESGPIIPQQETIESLDVQPVAKVDNDIMQETLELPKMATEEINAGINATKKCSHCGYENSYTAQTCVMCGETLE